MAGCIAWHVSMLPGLYACHEAARGLSYYLAAPAGLTAGEGSSRSMGLPCSLGSKRGKAYGPPLPDANPLL